MRNRNRPALTADVSLVFPPDPAWVRTARETVRTLVDSAGRGEELTDAAVLLTSEVVTNAIAACAATGTTDPLTLSAGWTDPLKSLRVLVHDEAPGRPLYTVPADDSEHGRGLQLLSSGADDWGVCTHVPGRGKSTWFELGRGWGVGTGRFERGYRWEGWLP
ncbi:ATP-binding protein [Streptomyces sp. NPDC087440]|uniref:ATP-binding protein n=1 Tax=Streptomyces sp. NPDC087440 TaxID=3365790 RepID=UPI0037F952BD